MSLLDTKLISNVLLVVPPLVNAEDASDPGSDRPDFENYRLISPVEPTMVASDLLNRGFDVKIFDMGTYNHGRFDRFSEYMAAVRPDAVVIVQGILTFATAQDWDGKRVFDLARDHCPDVVRVLTGIHATNYPGQAVTEGVCDYSIKGEVDFAVGDLLTGLNQNDDLSSLPGLAYRQSSAEVAVSPIYPVVDVTKLPLPAYHILDADQKSRYAETLEYGKIRFPEKSPFYRDVMTSRSCVLRCSFCSVAYLRGERQLYRRKSLDMVMAEIESALDDGIKEIHFFDDLFAKSEEQILEFTNEVTRRNLKFDWFVAQGMPMWPLTGDALRAMKETGMYRIICPLESGNNRVLKRVVGKGFSTTEHHHDVVTWAHDLDLEIIGMYVVGLPNETRDEILDTIKFADAHPEIDYSVFSIATPMIGTRLMKQVTKDGSLADPDNINRVIKRTLALYRTEEFAEYELGVIRAFDWDRVNFSTPERRSKYARMVGITVDQLDQMREHSKTTFYRYFPEFEGPYSFAELYETPGLYQQLEPTIPNTLY